MPVLRPIALTLLTTACHLVGVDVGTPGTLLPVASAATPPTPPPNACADPLGAPGVALAPDAAVFGAARTLAGFVVGPEPSQVHLGWPARDTSTSIAMLWNTDPGTLASVVEWGTREPFEHRDAGVSFTVGPPDVAPYRMHELRLCGRLTPGTTYRYRVGGDGHWSPTFQFTTPQAPGTFDSFTVAIAGDSRGSYEAWGQIVAKMAAHDPDLFLFSGDMVTRGDNPAEWLAWWDATDELFASKVVVPAHGNHEVLSAWYFANFSLPGREQWFVVDYGNATIASLNDTVTTPEDLQVRQPAFLREALSGSRAAWKIALHHRAEYSTSTAHGSARDLQAAWVPVFDEQGVDLVFAGHNHLYERSKPLRGGAVTGPGEGTVYFVSGGAGAPLYRDTEPAPFNAHVAVERHYLIAEFGPTAVTITARDLSDNVLDQVTLPRKR